MNQRFYLLKQQAIKEVDEYLIDDLESRADAVDQRFAELVVAESMMVCGAVQGAAQSFGNNGSFADGAGHCKVMLSRHFGVAL